jgi:hypothetical protein
MTLNVCGCLVAIFFLLSGNGDNDEEVIWIDSREVL